MNVVLPEWLVSEAKSLSDDQLVHLVRQQIEVAEMYENMKLMEQERREHYWQTYHSLPLWQRLRVRTGFLGIS